METSTGLPQLASDGRWRATSAYRLPKPRVQGALSLGGRWYLHSTGGGETGPGYLQAALPSGSGAGVLTADGPNTAVAIDVEDMSYWRSSHELWTVTEHVNQRILYSVYP